MEGRINATQLAALKAAGKVQVIVAPVVGSKRLLLRVQEQQVPQESLPQPQAQQNEPSQQHQETKSKINDKYTLLTKSQDTKFTWSRAATMKMLSIYDLHEIDRDFTKKNKKFWDIIAEELNTQLVGDGSTVVSGDQVHWKFMAIKKTYIKKKDHNTTSGNEPKEFNEFEARLCEILEGRRDKEVDKNIKFISCSPEGECSSVVCTATSSNPDSNIVNNDGIESPTTIVTAPGSSLRRKLVASRGTGSRVAKTKLELEKQWLSHLKFLEDNRETVTESMNSTKRQREEELDFRKKEFQLQKNKLRFEELKLEKKQERHRERMALEEKKIALMKEYIIKNSSLFE